MREIEERMLPLRLAAKAEGRVMGGWLKGVRQAIGIPVDALAERMEVRRREIFRLEKSEESERIALATLRRAARGLGCDLVYGLVPMEGTLGELAETQRRLREDAAKERQKKKAADREPYLKMIGWQESWANALRIALRRDGFRLRPRMTDRGDEEKWARFERNVKLLKLAGVLGPIVKEATEEWLEKGRE